MYTQLLPTFFGLIITVAALYYFGLIAAVWSIVLSNVLVQVSRFYFASKSGYQAVADRPFLYALLIYVFVTCIEYSLRPEMPVAILLAVAITGAIFWLYRFPVSLRNILTV